MELTLDSLTEGECARITALQAGGALRRRLLDFGLIEGTDIHCLRISPTGSPALYRVRGTMLALRRCDAKKIRVAACT